MHTLWIPAAPVVVFYLFIYLYNISKGRRLKWKGEVGSNILFIVVFFVVLTSAIAFILDPNYYSDQPGPVSFGQLHTTTRIMAVWVLALGFTGTYFAFIAPKRVVYNKASPSEGDEFWVGLKMIYILGCITAIASGFYGFFYRTSWGLFKSDYISDYFLWWAELAWLLVAIAGLIFYISHIRRWNGTRGSNDIS